MKKSILEMIPQYEVKEYPVGKEKQIQDLFSASYGGRILPIEVLRWKMEDNPCLSLRGTSLWDGDHLVAFNSLIPAKTIFKGKDIISAVSGTTMVDSKYLGASIQLMKECSKQNKDIELIYGFPNRNSYGIAVKYLGHKHLGEIAFWTMDVKCGNKNKSVRELYSFPDYFEGVSRNVAMEHCFCKVRDKEYMDWRFFKKPNNRYCGYELNDHGNSGYIIVNTYIENGIKQLQVVDILADTDEAFDELLSYAHLVATEKECLRIKLWMSSKHYSDILTDYGFICGERPFSMVSWDEPFALDESYITMADSDIF